MHPMFAFCQACDDHSVNQKLRERFHGAIRDLEAEGFVHSDCFEVNYSLAMLPMAIVCGIFGREVWRWNSPIRVSWYHPMMRSEDGTTIAYPLGLGIRYYTFFDDGSVQRTANCQRDESFSYLKRCNLRIANVTQKSVAGSSRYHRALCEESVRDGVSPLTTVSLDRFLELQIAEDEPSELIIASVLGWGGVGLSSLFLAKLATELI